MGQGFGFGGRPPFAPFARAAWVFASDVTCPPVRPSATAAGFLRGMGQPCEMRQSARVDVGAVRALGADRGQGGGQEHLEQGGDMRLSHRRILPNRLGYVKWAEC